MSRFLSVEFKYEPCDPKVVKWEIWDGPRSPQWAKLFWIGLTGWVEAYNLTVLWMKTGSLRSPGIEPDSRKTKLDMLSELPGTWRFLKARKN